MLQPLRAERLYSETRQGFILSGMGNVHVGITGSKAENDINPEDVMKQDDNFFHTVAELFVL